MSRSGPRAPSWFPPEFGWVLGCSYTGLTAYLTKLLLHADTRLQVLRRVPAGVARIARIKRLTDERLATSVTAPRGALRREFTGYLAGPWLYAAARWTARRSGARA